MAVVSGVGFHTIDGLHASFDHHKGALPCAWTDWDGAW
jgi:hypothetical protein